MATPGSFVLPHDCNFNISHLFEFQHAVCPWHGNLPVVVVKAVSHQALHVTELTALCKFTTAWLLLHQTPLHSFSQCSAQSSSDFEQREEG